MTQQTEALSELIAEGPPLSPDFMAKWAVMITGLPSEHACNALQDTARERIAQDVKWGEQNHPDGTSEDYQYLADAFRAACQEAAAKGETTWAGIFLEEAYEALAEEDPVKLRKELIQVAAVATAWVESMDRRGRQETLFDA